MGRVGGLVAIVLDWNLPELTVRCVRDLVSDGLDPDRIVVLENGPTEETWERIRSELGECMLVRLDRNVGFARANNIGAGLVSADAYLFCNNDAFVNVPGSLNALYQALERDRTGIAVPRLVNRDLTLQPTVAPFTTPGVAAVRASGLSRLIPNRWQPRWSTHWDHATSRDVDAAIGAVVAVRAEAWEELGGFRESSFMYAEDIDLCWRASNLGWRTRFVAEAEFVHYGGSSSSTRWSDRERAEQVGTAEAQVIRENLPPRKAAVSIALMRLGLHARSLVFAGIGKREAAASCRGSAKGLAARTPPATERLGDDVAVEVVPPST